MWQTNEEQTKATGLVPKFGGGEAEEMYLNSDAHQSYKHRFLVLRKFTTRMFNRVYFTSKKNRFPQKREAKKQ